MTMIGVVLALWTMFVAFGGAVFAVFLMKQEVMGLKVLGACILPLALSLLLLPAEYYGLIP